MHVPHPDRAGARVLTLRQANTALFVFLLAYALSFADRQILSLMVDPIRADLGLSDLEIGLLQGVAFALLYATMGIPFGLMADRVSRHRQVAGGILFWSAATAACGMARNFTFLFLARVGVGVGEAALSPAVHSYLSNAFPREKLARAMATYNLGLTIGGGAALILGGAIVGMVVHMSGVQVPLVGALKGWQIAFLIVAAPGILLATAALSVREPPRARHYGGSAQEVRAASLPEVWRYLRANRRTFLSIHFSSAAFGLYGYSFLGWYPTLLMRSHGLTAAQAGLALGLNQLVLGSAGAICGGLYADLLTGKGHHDANLRVVLGVALLVLLPATATPLMPNVPALLFCLAPAVFLFNGYFGCSVAAIQLASPPSMRGISSALFLLTNSLVGLSVGMVIVPVIDRAFFGGTGAFGPALAVVAALACSGAALIALAGIGPYGRLVAVRMRAEDA